MAARSSLLDWHCRQQRGPLPLRALGSRPWLFNGNDAIALAPRKLAYQAGLSTSTCLGRASQVTADRASTRCDRPSSPRLQKSCASQHTSMAHRNAEKSRAHKRDYGWANAFSGAWTRPLLFSIPRRANPTKTRHHRCRNYPQVPPLLAACTLEVFGSSSLAVTLILQGGE